MANEVTLARGNQLDGTTETLYTSTNIKTKIDAATITNDSGSAETCTFHIVPSGGSADDTNVVYKAYSIPGGGKPVVLWGLLNKTLQSGETLQASASTADTLSPDITGKVLP